MFHAIVSTSSMSLEKEPAGAFNKAQRLIEYEQYTRCWLIYKEGCQFVFGPPIQTPPGAVRDISGVPAGLID